MSYVFLDLEWNGSYSKTLHRFVNEIIEFGAVKTDDEFNITDTFSVLIKPHIAKKLCSKVKQLTKITNGELKQNGITFMEAVGRFSEFAEDSVIVTWSTSDIHALIENYSYYTDDYHLPFLSHYCNLQEYCESCLDVHDASAQLGLSVCADMLGVEYSEDEQHRAFADAELSLKCLARLSTDFDIKSFVMDAGQEEFYTRMMFKTHFVTDINSPDVDKSVMFFECEECKAPLVQMSPWRVHNKAFVATFGCENCQKEFTGRISFKKRYESVTVRKRLSEKKKPQSEEDEQNSSDDI